ncbi:hypothetical protein RESH_03917 [Rhodopirellula europaea SH398]|uniref:Uncharacterized protein n=1 Tax=Rhodopirellula europaea SH398 TaxID=1263868 RepID=M5S278_9BACT|nr:hypothetical protein RESH_03917 [Rhodopirellula europaea SH398]
MPFNNCQQCRRLFHFLEPTHRVESVGNWPSDLDSLCPDCRRMILHSQHGSKAAEDDSVEGQSEDTKRFDFGE